MPNPEPEIPILSTRTFVLVWAALLLLTAGTVAVARWRLLANYSVLGSLGIASLKAALVLGFFMHLRYESPLIRWLALGALFALLVILAGTFADVWYRG